ncbi:MAG: fibronectin type III-like domain-contianing protein, partial [Melioribacteraceae bacterium]|nr:fibronectin type III-like domain-contianing protein [Melioribacteraceae bacterium]
SVDVQNTGNYDGDEVVQLYVKDIESSVPQPSKRLREFKRINLGKGDIKTMVFELDENDFSFWDEKIKDWRVESGEFEIMVGASSSDIRLKTLIKL